MSNTPHHKSYRYQQARLEMFRIYGTVCHLCGHDDADTADHLEPVSLNPGQPISPHTMRPAHGVTGCPTCGLACNQTRGNQAIRATLRTSRDW